MPAEIPTECRSTAVYMDSKKVNRATLYATYTGEVIFYMSVDGGNNWEAITPNEIHNFVQAGAEVRWMAVGAYPATLSLVQIEYEVEQT